MTLNLEHRISIALDAFAALSAVGGGLAILAGWIQFPVEWRGPDREDAHAARGLEEPASADGVSDC